MYLLYYTYSWTGLVRQRVRDSRQAARVTGFRSPRREGSIGPFLLPKFPVNRPKRFARIVVGAFPLAVRLQTYGLCEARVPYSPIETEYLCGLGSIRGG